MGGNMRKALGTYRAFERCQRMENENQKYNRLHGRGPGMSPLMIFGIVAAAIVVSLLLFTGTFSQRSSSVVTTNPTTITPMTPGTPNTTPTKR